MSNKIVFGMKHVFRPFSHAEKDGNKGFSLLRYIMVQIPVDMATGYNER